jgi:hypothetical protein
MHILSLLESFGLFKDHLTKNGIWRGVADDLIKEFKELVASGKITGEQKDINFWRRRPVEEFEKFLQDRRTLISKKAEKRAVKGGDTINAGTIGNYKVILPVSLNSSAIYGSGTKWCTAGTGDSCKKAFSQYQSVKHAVAYMIPTDGKSPKWGLLFNTNYSTKAFDAFDQADKFHTKDEFLNATGIDGNALVSMVAAVEAQRMNKVVDMANSSFQSAYEYVEQGGNPELVKNALVTNIRGAMLYLSSGGKDMSKISTMPLPHPDFIPRFRNELERLKILVPEKYWPPGLDSI